MVDNWRDLRAYQEIHDNLHEEADNPTETLTEHIDLSCLVCNVADTARAPTFDNFWYITTTYYQGKSWTNNTVTEFEYLRGIIRTYLSSEDEEEKNQVGPRAFRSAKRLLQIIRYKDNPEEDLENIEHIIINTGVHTVNYTQGERIEEVYQATKLKTVRRKQPEPTGEPSGSGEQDTYHDTRTSQTPPIPLAAVVEEQTSNPFGTTDPRSTTPEDYTFIYPIPPTTTSTIVNPHTPGSRPYHLAVPTISETIVQDDSPEHQEPLNIPGGRPRSASSILPITQSLYRNLTGGGSAPPGITTTPNIFGHLGFGLTPSSYGQVPPRFTTTINMSQGFGKIGGTQGTGFERYSFL